MASSSKTSLLLCFMFALVILISSKVSAGELVEITKHNSYMYLITVSIPCKTLCTFLYIPPYGEAPDDSAPPPADSAPPLAYYEPPPAYSPSPSEALDDFAPPPEAPADSPPPPEAPANSPPSPEAPAHSPPLPEAPAHSPPSPGAPAHSPPLPEAPADSPPSPGAPAHSPPPPKAPAHSVAGGVFIILLVFGILRRRGLQGQQNALEDDLKGVDLQTGKFSFRQLKAATNNFDEANKIGGGFGSVYKGLLSDGTVIAVKQLSSKSKQGNHEFVNEIGMISALEHPHLVKLHGCCIEGNQLLLVYEYMENNSLARALFGKYYSLSQLKLDWPTRHKICVGIARGLAYLHEESTLKVVHRDIKATNVLLDKNLTPKISDFGLAKLDEEDNTHISTRIAGTYGAPEYATRGYLTDKADAYSFGILVLEIVSGRNNTTYRGKEKSFYLLDWAQLLKGQGNLMELVDPSLGSDFNEEEIMLTINVALLCCNLTSTVRPTMSSVVSMLEGRAAVHELVSDPNASSFEIEAMRKHFQSSFGRNTGKSQTQTAPTEGTWTGSSSSAHDLYPVKPDSTYWDNRK
ncbi:unnamed protein product [Prunus brigantina]